MLLLLACTGAPSSTDTTDDPLDDTAAEGDSSATPGPAFVGAAIRTPHGQLEATCEIRVTIAGDQEADLSAAVRGGETLGTSFPGGGTFRITGHDEDCHEDSDGIDFASNASSLGDGEAFLWWWNIGTESVATLSEAHDYVAGELTLEVDNGAPADQVLDYVETVGGVGAPLKEPETYRVTFDPAVGTFQMLAALSAYDRFVDATPTWKNGAPGWW